MWFPQEYVPGVSASGRRAQWTYMTGVFSAGEANRELGEFTSGLFTLGRLGYNFGARLGIKEALLVGEYVFQHADAGNTFTRQLDHIASINLKLEEADWGLRTDVTLASGYAGQSNLAGAMVMPYLNVTERLQLVAQYTRVSSADPNGVQLGNYANRVVDGRGDEYDEAYLGANYYVYGHKLKVQTGLEYGKLNDRANDGGAYAGFAFTAGLRVGW